MAVFHGKLLDGFFIRPFYKMMLGKSIELKVGHQLEKREAYIYFRKSFDSSVVDLYRLFWIRYAVKKG
jgi:hypothetical protein